MVVKTFEKGAGQLLPYESKYRRLVIEWSPKHLNIALVNTLSHSVEAAERFEGSLANEENWIALHQQSRLLPLTDLQAWLWADSHRVTAAPGEWFDPETSAAFIEVQHGQLRSVCYQSDLDEAHQMVIAWQIPEQVLRFFQEHFAVLTVRHVFSAMLTNPTNGPFLKMVAAPEHVFLALHSQQQLLHLAPYPSHSGNNLAFHVLNLLRHYDLSADTVNVSLSGCTENAAWYEVFSSFLPRVSFAVLPPGAGEGYNQYFAHMIEPLL
jgi:hypothetical protein